MHVPCMPVYAHMPRFLDNACVHICALLFALLINLQCRCRIHKGAILTSQCKLNYWACSSKRQLVITACSWRHAEHMVPIILQQHFPKSDQLLWNAILVSCLFKWVSNFTVLSILRQWLYVKTLQTLQKAPCLHCKALTPLVGTPTEAYLWT